MAPNSSFVCGGGWIECPRFGRPKLRRFLTLAGVWLLVSAWPLWPVCVGLTEPGLVRLTLFCAVFILPESVFVLVTVYFWWFEEPRQWTKLVENPSDDPDDDYSLY